MAFGQPAGPPATHRQLQDLLGLLQEAGHEGFRDARGPLGLTQRQGSGKFTRDEADALITQLQDAAESGTEVIRPPSPARRSASEQVLHSMPAELLAAELQRRGWVVMEP